VPEAATPTAGADRNGADASGADASGADASGADASGAGPGGAPAGTGTVAVVGGGISGLTAAWRLATLPRPPRVILLDAAPEVGGKLAVGAVGPVEIDLGAESMLARRPEGIALAREVGLGALLVHPVTTRANVLRAGRLHPLPGGTVMGVPSRVEGLAGLLTDDEVRRVAAEPHLPAPPLDADTDVASWVTARVGRAVVDRLVEPLLGGVYAGHADRLSLAATVPALWQRARAGGSLLAAPAALAAPVTQVAEPAAPAEATTPAEPAAPVFAGLAGGVGRLPRALARQLAARGVELRSRTTVRELVPRPGGGWRLGLGPAPAGGLHHGSHLDVDAVVLAVPARAASRLLGTACPAAAVELAGIEAASVAVVAAVVERATLAGLPGSGVLVPPREGRAVKAMTFSSAKWAWVDALDGRLAVVRLSLGRHCEEAVLQRDDADLAALALADAGEVLGRPLAPATVATRVVRWGGSLPQPAVGHLDRIARLRAAVAAVPGLAVCGAALDGVGIPACIAAATRAAGEVAAHLGGARGSRAAGDPGPRARAGEARMGA